MKAMGHSVILDAAGQKEMSCIITSSRKQPINPINPIKTPLITGIILIFN